VKKETIVSLAKWTVFAIALICFCNLNMLGFTFYGIIAGLLAIIEENLKEGKENAENTRNWKWINRRS